MRYRRACMAGGCYFFTLVTYNRRAILIDPDHVDLMRSALRKVMTRYPFVIEAFVLLPDHLHCIWTLPEGDADFSTRWRLIKSEFSRGCHVGKDDIAPASRRAKEERTVWQRRFWEHLIRDEQDFRHHVDYIHYNPVKHGLALTARDWHYSSFHRYLQRGMYPADWGGQNIEEPVGWVE